MNCPECGSACGRDEVDNGVAVLCGPWGCGCGWSEDEAYRHSDEHDSRGGFTPPQSVEHVAGTQALEEWTR